MIIIVTASFAPAVALLMFFYLKDELEPEPVYLVIRSFFFGMLLVFPVSFLQFAIGSETDMTNTFLVSFFHVALTEEFFKWFVVVLFIFNHSAFKTRYDGIVYASAVSLGFAAVENLLYVSINGLETAIYRALFPVTVHALVGVLMGYYVGAAKFNFRFKAIYLLLALLIPAFFHGMYHLSLVRYSAVNYGLMPFMIVLWFTALYKIKQANQLSLSEYLKRGSHSLYSGVKRNGY
ncbi:glutamic-type intramembrane protease PrsW [Salisediminibacterium beveridgei]|uniref:Protease PrsW n=1 Tax=Salisediminibacterium beveridgei TaxID=632773 RepID=A0A1D7QUV2_9BACI|nr:glutamic-type intramembrane protease PrsW [Salisediminibacterium beveridgei]AOM82785.1 Protease prsW [Salisediminibacterium beveridgei]